MSRIKYPNRTVYFGLQTGLLDEKAYAEHVERERLARLARLALYTGERQMQVTPIEDFKTEFDITC